MKRKKTDGDGQKKGFNRSSALRKGYKKRGGMMLTIIRGLAP